MMNVEAVVSVLSVEGRAQPLGALLGTLKCTTKSHAEAPATVVDGHFKC
ncbi:MAG: hypothetical protein ACI841_005178 [Planctomycetota bacterium]|jgi:hypothetical protein